MTDSKLSGHIQDINEDLIEKEKKFISFETKIREVDRRVDEVNDKKEEKTGTDEKL